ncbi:MAG: endolytic transglycosylase MltG [Alphaproteobacteria bacterium]
MTEPPEKTPLPESTEERRFAWGALFGVMALGGFLCALALAASLLVPGPAIAPQTVMIPKNSGAREIGRILENSGIVYHHLHFALAARAIARGTLRAGEYEFPAAAPILDIIAKMQAGETVVHRLTIPEGLTAAEIVALVKTDEALAGEVSAIPEEGTLLPSTYHFSRGDLRQDLLARMEKLEASLLRELWEKRDPGLPFATPEEARVLASIVEKETGHEGERPRVAGLFINRLRQGMKLQADPTVIYALTQGRGPLDRPLSHADLAFDSPYNTYVAAGLPPKPIANPGRAALEAVMHPEKHGFLYFVADGSGGHVFSRTLEEHNINVANWRRLEKR